MRKEKEDGRMVKGKRRRRRNKRSRTKRWGSLMKKKMETGRRMEKMKKRMVKTMETEMTRTGWMMNQ